MKPAKPQTDRWQRPLRFLAGCGFATLVHWLTMLMLIQSGTDARVATATGATAGLVINYLAQYHYTFQSRLPHRRAFSRYLASAGLGWSLNLAGFSAIYAVTGAVLVSQAIATATATAANYLLAEKFVFQGESTDDIH